MVTVANFPQFKHSDFWVWVTHDKVDETPWWPANIFRCSHFTVTESYTQKNEDVLQLVPNIYPHRFFKTTTTQLNSNHCR